MNKPFETNLQFVDLLNGWNPFQLEEEDYDTEIADTIQAVHELDHPFSLAKRIQGIYEFSFEKIIPMESCLKIAQELLAIKNQGTCSI